MLHVITLIVFDYLFIFSCTFLVVYLAALLAASLIPAERSPTPSSLGIPFLALVSALLLFTPWEAFFTAVLRFAASFAFSTEQDVIARQHRVMLAVWLAGIAACFLFFAKKALILWAAIRSSADAGTDPAFAQAVKAVGLRRPVRLKCSASFTSAASWVFRDAYVFVPEDFTASYDERERYMLYLHELTHIKKRDSLKCLAAGALAVIFWYNPVFAHALRRFKSHIEVACDKAVLKLGVGREEYGDLVGKCIASRRKNAPALNFSSAYMDAARRFRYLFHDSSFLPARTDRRLAWRCLAGCALLAVLSLMFSGDNAKRLPGTGETITRELPTGEVLEEYYIYARHGAIGTFTRTRVVSRGFAMTDPDWKRP